MLCIACKEIPLNEKSTPELESEVDCGAQGDVENGKAVRCHWLHQRNDRELWSWLPESA